MAVMRGIRLIRRGIDCLVSGMNGGSDGPVSASSSRLEGRVWVETDGWVVENVEFGAGAVEGRTHGLGSGGSREVVRRGMED